MSKTNSLILSILLLLSTILSTVVCVFDFSIYRLIISIFLVLSTISMASIQIWQSLEFTNKVFILCYDHQFCLDGVNLFENVDVIKQKDEWYGKKELKDWLIKPNIDLVKNNTKNISFEIYELKNDLQLIAFDTRKIKGHIFYDVQIENEKILIKNVDIPELPFGLGIEHFTSKDKTTIITIDKTGDVYYSRKYVFGVTACDNIKKVFKTAYPHWSEDYYAPTYESLEEAIKDAVDEMDTIDSVYFYEKPNHYFILERQRRGTCYHEFQTGNKQDVYWDKTSILLSDDFMDETKFDGYLAKILPNYSYTGITLVTKEDWAKLKKEAKNENETIQELIKELTPWAENSIASFECFTIKGI